MGVSFSVTTKLSASVCHVHDAIMLNLENCWQWNPESCLYKKGKMEFWKLQGLFVCPLPFSIEMLKGHQYLRRYPKSLDLNASGMQKTF